MFRIAEQGTVQRTPRPISRRIMTTVCPARVVALSEKRFAVKANMIRARMRSLSTDADHRISIRGRVAALVVRANVLLLLFVVVQITTPILVGVEAKAPSPSNPSHAISSRLSSDTLNSDFDDRNDNENPGSKPSPRHGSAFQIGFGREISLFETGPRGGARNNNYANDYSFEGYSDDCDGMYDDESDEDDDGSFFTRMERYRERRKSISSLSGSGYNNNYNSNSNEGRSMPWSQFQRRPKQKQQKTKPPLIQKAQNWWMNNIDPTLQSLPKMVCRIEPTTTLKLRKTFRPLKTIIQFGADYNTQQGIWQFKSSWEDSVIGGKLTLTGNKELQLTKSWQMSVGGVEDLVTRLKMRATINLQTFQAYARVGFRTERLTPIDVLEGFTILKQVPLDGSKGNIKLEVKANVALPEPEIEYSTEAQRSVIGMGNIEVSIDEMNLLLDY